MRTIATILSFFLRLGEELKKATLAWAALRLVRGLRRALLDKKRIRATRSGKFANTGIIAVDRITRGALA
jgi:hypothetical protein